MNSSSRLMASFASFLEALFLDRDLAVEAVQDPTAALLVVVTHHHRERVAKIFGAQPRTPLPLA